MEFSGPIIDLDSARELLRRAVPTWKDLLEHLESSGGRLKFLPEVSSMIANLRIDNYPLLYENTAAIGNVLAPAFMDTNDMVAFNVEVENASPAGRGQMIADMLVNLDAIDPAFDFSGSDAEKQQAKEAFAALDPKTQKEAVDFFQRLMMGSLASFFDYLAIAVHGEKLTSLVAQAKNGDDEAFGKAVQIDGRILIVLPYFKDRYARAITEDHENFRIMVSRKLSSPPYKGRIEHKSLWMTFAFLEGVGLLSVLPRNELLDLCNDVGVGDSGQPIEDVKNLNKRLSLYREFQSRGTLSTP